jgi:uncharacterized membrane protein
MVFASTISDPFNAVPEIELVMVVSLMQFFFECSKILLIAEELLRSVTMVVKQQLGSTKNPISA